MSSIDLIPADYRDGLERRRHAQGAAWLIACVGLAALLATVGLRAASARLTVETEKLRAQHALTAQQRDQLTTLDGRLAELEEEWTLLRGLRSGAAAEDLFVIVDRALPGGDVWFLDWAFRRAGVVVPQNPRTVSTGYFIVVPAETQEAPEDWQIRTHMSITGQARDHAALSRFVRGLYQQPEIREVKVNSTRVQQYQDTRVVDFDLAVVLHVEPAGAS